MLPDCGLPRLSLEPPALISCKARTTDAQRKNEVVKRVNKAELYHLNILVSFNIEKSKIFECNYCIYREPV